MIKGPVQGKGSYILMKRFKKTVFMKYSEVQDPGCILAFTFRNAQADNLDKLFDTELNLTITEIERLSVDRDRDPQFYSDFKKSVIEAKTDLIKLENGAEALLIRPGDLDPKQLHPMVT
jgi:hypothetical protein